MDNHIDFVENTYNSLKAPLQFVKDKVNMITGGRKENYLLSKIKIQIKLI